MILVFKDIIEDIKLSKLSYLLETILLRKMNEKIKAFNKIKKMKITKEMGLKILEYSVKKYDSKIGEETFCLPLISLCLENYYDEYDEKIKEIFDKLDKNNKTKVLTIISFIDKESAVKLYAYLVLKYFKDEEHLPFGTLSNNEANYEYLFPELYKSFDFKVKRNNVLILLNDFVLLLAYIVFQILDVILRYQLNHNIYHLLLYILILLVLASQYNLQSIYL